MQQPFCLFSQQAQKEEVEEKEGEETLSEDFEELVSEPQSDDPLANYDPFAKLDPLTPLYETDDLLGQKKGIQLFKRRRGLFHKTPFNPQHIYPSEQQKEPLPQWSDPTVNWPPLIPKAVSKKGKALIAEIEREECKKIEESRPFKVPPFRSGDVVEVTQFESLSEGKFTTFKGQVVGISRRNRISRSFRLHIMEEDEKVILYFNTLSPLIAKIEVVEYGKNYMRNKHMHVIDTDWTK